MGCPLHPMHLNAYYGRQRNPEYAHFHLFDPVSNIHQNVCSTNKTNQNHLASSQQANRLNVLDKCVVLFWSLQLEDNLTVKKLGQYIGDDGRRNVETCMCGVDDLIDLPYDLNDQSVLHLSPRIRPCSKQG